MKLAMHQPNYLPALSYFDKASNADLFVFTDDFQFSKGSFTNRNKIRTPQGWSWLTVPIMYTHPAPVNKVRLQGRDWQKKHLSTVHHMLCNTKGYHIVRNILLETFKTRWNNLAELNIALNLRLFTFLGIGPEITLHSRLQSRGTDINDKIIGMCHELGADTYLSGVGGRKYLDVEALESSGIKVEWQQFEHPVYEQKFEGFHYYMSVIDYIANTGQAFLPKCTR